MFEPVEPKSSHKRASFGTNLQATMVKSWGPIHVRFPFAQRITTVKHGCGFDRVAES